MPTPLPAPIYVRDLVDSHYDDRQRHARAAHNGDELRLARGAYLATQAWQSLEGRHRYLLQIRAVSETRRHDMVLSHWSAAAVHGLPILGAWPSKVHFIVGKVSGGRSRNAVVKHALSVSTHDVVEVDGLLVTSIPRTVLDMAVSASHLQAVMVADRALLIDRFHRVLPLAEREELWAAYRRAGNFRGQRRAQAVISFAATSAESPLESVSRANMRIIGCPEPKLQEPMRDHRGKIGEVDFYWPQLRLVGEADGRSKYLNPALRGNRTADEVLVDEKHREDRIRATGEGVTRWPWEVGVSPRRLAEHLRQAGIPIP
jgi:hypothetical protein